ncbi:hypothetical protein DFH09DRAFT_1377016 [Mycena vulgaris]|nr:hypothetical protein DFH09DRAFT_1377016 [Mycena vulgaris]
MRYPSHFLPVLLMFLTLLTLHDQTGQHSSSSSGQRTARSALGMPTAQTMATERFAHAASLSFWDDRRGRRRVEKMPWGELFRRGINFVTDSGVAKVTMLPDVILAAWRTWLIWCQISQMRSVLLMPPLLIYIKYPAPAPSPPVPDPVCPQNVMTPPPDQNRRTGEESDELIRKVTLATIHQYGIP